MTVSPSNQRARGLEPPLRRVLAVDAGTRCVRLLLLESYFGRLRVLRQDALDLQQEGLVAAEELQAHLQKTLAQWGRPPLALVLPQQAAVSQIVDLPPVPDDEARKLIEAETVKLAGVSESAMVYDFVRVPSQSENRQSFWVTFCQEGEIQNRITQLGLDGEDFREITTGANGLLTAWLAAPGRQPNTVLVHAGAQGTTIVVVRDGTGVLAASFPMGGDFFTRAIARLRRCSNEAAEAAKVSTNLLEGPKALPGFAEIVDGWAAELKRQLAEWHAGNPRAIGDLSKYELVATGGAFEQPGLLEHLLAKAGLKFQRWPIHDAPEAVVPTMGFEIALGVAFQALGLSTQPASLVPAHRRAVWHRRLGRQRLEFANTAVLALCLVVLVFGLWQKISLIHRKQELIAKVQAGIETVQANAALTTDLLGSYDGMRVLFERQQNTVDTLRSLALLQEARSNRAAWYVLLADQQSYFSYPATPAPTNKPAGPLADPENGLRNRDNTNAPPARPGLIAELCVPDTAEGARGTLGLVVGALKRSPVFARVDLLSEDLRRSLAEPKVLVKDRHFALALDFATAEFQPPGRRPRTSGPGRSSLRPAPGLRSAEDTNKPPPAL